VECLREKLNSRRGASILIALLFLLVCMMVASSILMAAASNAGRLKSNREEQQKYLTLSSALNLVIDELEQAEYEGKYKITEWIRTTEIVTQVNGEESSAVDLKDEPFYTCEQLEGKLTCGTAGLADQLAGMEKGLETIFAQGLRESINQKVKTLASAPLPVEEKLTITVESAGDPSSFKPVTVELSLTNGYHIYLNAVLKDGAEGDAAAPVYAMRAELTPSATPVIVKKDELSPSVWWEGEMLPTEGETHSSVSAAEDATITTTITYHDFKDTQYPTLEKPERPAKVKWKLNWIQKGGG